MSEHQGSPEAGNIFGRSGKGGMIDRSDGARPFATPAVSCLALVIGTMSPAVAAMADAAVESGAGVEEILVTARKREENLQDVPIAVSAFSAEMIARRGFANMADLNTTVPNLGWQPPPSGGTSSSAFFSRGVGQFDYVATSDQSVGLYVDGVYVARSIGALLNVVDIERIEVLRGPQGTLFGRNTPAGAIQVFSRKPDLDSSSGWVEAGVGSFGRMNAKASINTPVASGVAIKVTAATLNEQGYGTALINGRSLNQQQDWLVRGQLRADPARNVRINLSIDYSEHAGTANSLKLQSMDDSDAYISAYNLMLVSQGFAPISSENFVDGSRYDSWKGAPFIDDNSILSATGDVEIDLSDSVTLRSITGYRHLKARNAQDFDGTPYPMVDQTVVTDSKQFSQEFQFNGSFLDDHLSTVAGLYYFREHVVEELDNLTFAGISRTGLGDFDFVFDPTVEGLPGIYNLNSVVTIDQVAQSYAVFGEATYAVTDSLSLTGGIRYTKDKKKLDHTNTARGLVSISDEWPSVTPRATLSWRPTREVMAFATVSRGFRSGGFNGRATTDISSFKPESIWSYEAGIRTDLFDRRVRFNVTGFYYDYKNVQGTVLQSDQTIGVGNVGAVEMYGAEFETVIRPIDGLRIEGNLGLLSHSIKSINTGDGIPGLTYESKLPNAPKVTASGAIEYQIDIGNLGSITPRVDVSYKSKHEFLLPNYDGEAQEGYALVNARLSWLTAQDKLQISVYGKNIFDKSYRVYGQNTIGFGYGMLLASYGRPAEFGLDLKFYF